MKLLEINNEWRIAVDSNGNYMPERYVIRDCGKSVGGKETKAFEGWERQGVYHANEIQAVNWIATKVNHEGCSEHILESLKDIVSRMKVIMASLT